MKKISSPIPFEFHGGIKLPKGESEFPYEKLTPEGQEFFDGLVKAEVVTVLADEPPAETAPAAPAAKRTRKKADEAATPPAETPTAPSLEDEAETAPAAAVAPTEPSTPTA